MNATSSDPPLNPADTIELTLGSPPPDDRRALLEELLEYNRRATGISDDDELSGFLRDDSGALLAGLYGWIYGGTCEIALLWVREDHRGQGLGTRLLDAAEGKARTVGSHQMLLRTHDFQAPDFYQARGYRQVAVVDEYPRGHRWYTFVKPL